MAFTGSIIRSFVPGTGTTLTQTTAVSGNARQSISESVPDTSTDLLIALTLDVSTIQSIYINSDQDMTLETNNGAAPDDTLNLKADVPYVWHTGDSYANLLTTDITALYLTNASGSAATLTIEVIHDPTP